MIHLKMKDSIKAIGNSVIITVSKPFTIPQQNQYIMYSFMKYLSRNIIEQINIIYGISVRRNNFFLQLILNKIKIFCIGIKDFHHFIPTFLKIFHIQTIINMVINQRKTLIKIAL